MLNHVNPRKMPGKNRKMFFLLSSQAFFTFLYVKALTSVGVLRLILFLSLLGFKNILLGTKSGLGVACIVFTYCKIIWSK